MRKFYLIILIQYLFFNINNIYGQNGSQIDDNTILPNRTPPSPDSFNITKYGDLNVNEFIGKTAIQVPLYAYTSGQLTVNLSLNHDGSGVKVDDMSNWTGSNWTLDSGGLITRTINDLADELTYERKYINNLINFNNQYNTPDGTIGATELSNIISSNTYDSEVDLFNYVIPGYSGSFYLDENFLPVQTKQNDEIKIITNGDFILNKEFIVIAPNGIKYFFGGQSGIESTYVRNSPYTSAVTSFFITKIEHPISGKIFYEYENQSSRMLKIGKEQQIIKFDKYIFPDFQELGFTSNSAVLNNCPQNFGDNNFDVIETSSTYMMINNHKILRRIFSDMNNVEIFFNSELNVNNLNYDRKLNSIELKNTNIQIGKINFEYIENIIGNEKQRIFLSKILFNNESQINSFGLKKYEEYRFVYNDINSLPKRGSFSQDFIGYFNNNSNYSLISNSVPTINDEFETDNSGLLILNDTRFGNRFPNFNYATKGILTDIYYPTGGHTHFEYESEPAKKRKYITYSSELSGNTIPGYNSYGEYVSFKPVYQTQTVQIVFFVTSDNPANNHFCQSSLKISDLTDINISPTIFTKSVGYNPTPTKYEYTFLQGHTYKIEILPNNNTACNLESNFFVSLFDGYEITDNIGIRLKRMSDFENENAMPVIKRYYYSHPKNINIPVENLPFIKVPNFQYGMMINKLFNSSSCINFELPTFFLAALEMQAYYFIYKSNSFNNFFTNNNTRQTYPEVTISYGGDNFENGGVYKIFENRLGNSPLYFFPLTPRRFPIGELYFRDFLNKKSNEDDLSGELLDEIYLEKISNQLYIKKHIKKTFQINIVNEVHNLVGKKVCDYSINFVPTNTTLSNYVYGTYSYKTFKKINTSTVTKEYYEPYSIYNSEDTNYKKIVTTQTFEYGALKGLPTIITSSTSDTNTSEKTINTYVNTASSLGGLPANQASLYASLVAQNRVDSPVQTQQLKNGELLTSQRTLFSTVNSNGISKILPEKIQISKGSQPLEDKAIFYKYDSQFNPVVMGYKDGTKTKYIFNTEGLVVAKIENYTGTETTFPLIIGNIDNSSCSLQAQNPTALVTVFQYNLITKKLTKITDSNCRNTFYEYDNLQRLKFIKDHDGNILKEFDHNYKN